MLYSESIYIGSDAYKAPEPWNKKARFPTRHLAREIYVEVAICALHDNCKMSGKLELIKVRLDNFHNMAVPSIEENLCFL